MSSPEPHAGGDPFADRVEPVEFVITKGGEVRQAGATIPGSFVEEFRAKAEADLFVFGKGILGLDRLTQSLHLPACRFLSRFPPYRKLLLMPRDHLKTSMCRALVLHILLQNADSNPYFPGMEGCNTRILLANETATNAQHQLRWIMIQLEANELLRAFWPHRVWDNARRESKKWNGEEIMIPRNKEYPEASIETIGVGGAVTGRHYDVLLKDDLVTLEAANSPTLMYNAIEWHKTSRALMDDPDKSLEIIIGTRWAVHDLYSYIERNDPTVEVICRKAVEGGEPIFPEMFSLVTLQRLKDELGSLFSLLYMNSAADPELTDFDMNLIRRFSIENGLLRFDENTLDAVLEERASNSPDVNAIPPPKFGKVVKTGEIFDLFKARKEHLGGRRLRLG